MKKKSNKRRKTTCQSLQACKAFSLKRTSTFLVWFRLRRTSFFWWNSLLTLRPLNGDKREIPFMVAGHQNHIKERTNVLPMLDFTVLVGSCLSVFVSIDTRFHLDVYHTQWSPSKNISQTSVSELFRSWSPWQTMWIQWLPTVQWKNGWCRCHGWIAVTFVEWISESGRAATTLMSNLNNFLENLGKTHFFIWNISIQLDVNILFCQLMAVAWRITVSRPGPTVSFGTRILPCFVTFSFQGGGCYVRIHSGSIFSASWSWIQHRFLMIFEATGLITENIENCWCLWCHC